MTPEQVEALVAQHRDLLNHAQQLVDSITFDDAGQMVAGRWVGGSGGLMSRETIRVGDAVRTRVTRYRQALTAFQATS